MRRPGLASLAVPACAGGFAGGRDLPGVTEFVEHKSYRPRTYAGDRPLDVACAEFGAGVVPDVLADAMLLRAVVGACGGDPLLKILIGAVAGLSTEIELGGPCCASRSRKRARRRADARPALTIRRRSGSEGFALHLIELGLADGAAI